MLKAARIREERVAELLRFVATSGDADAAIPAGLEDRVVAFAMGAVAVRSQARRRRTRDLKLGLVAACAAAVIAVVVGLPFHSRAPNPATTRETTPIAIAPATVNASERDAAPAATDSAVVEAVVSSPDSRTRRAAITHLRRTDDGKSREAEAALARAVLTDPNWRAREMALAAYLDHPRATADWVLAEAMADPHIALRFAALSAVSSQGTLGPATRTALEARLERDPDWRIREAALNLLLRDGNRERVAALALRDSHRHLREIGERALASAQKSAAGALEVR